MAFLPASSTLLHPPSQQQDQKQPEIQSTTPIKKMQIPPETAPSSPMISSSYPATPTTPECPPSPGGGGRSSGKKVSMSLKKHNFMKNIRKHVGKRPGTASASASNGEGGGGTSTTSGGISVVSGGDGSGIIDERSTLAPLPISPRNLAVENYQQQQQQQHGAAGGGPILEMEVPTSVMTNQGNPQGAADVARDYCDDRQTIDGGRSDGNTRHGMPSANETATMAANFQSNVRPSTPPPQHNQQQQMHHHKTPPTLPLFQFISDDNFTRRVDSYDGQVIVCSDSKLPTYEVGNYLGGGVAGVVYEGRRLRPVNEYPPVRVRGGGAFYPNFSGAIGGGVGSPTLPPGPPVAMSMSSSSLSSIRRRINTDPVAGRGTGLFAEVHRAVVPEAYYAGRGSGLAQSSTGQYFSPSGRAQAITAGGRTSPSTFMHRTADDTGGCTSFLFGGCGNCGNDSTDDGNSIPLGATPMPGVHHLNGTEFPAEQDVTAQTARQRYLAVDMSSIEVPAAFSSYEQETPANQSAHPVVVDDADAPNRSKREARALSRNAPQSALGIGGASQGGSSADYTARESSSLLYNDEPDPSMIPHLLEDMSETVAIKILNPVGFRLIDSEMLRKAVIVREGTLPTVEPDGSFKLREEHVWWLVNPNSRNLRSLLRKNNQSQSHSSGGRSSRRTGEDDASEESSLNLSRQQSSFGGQGGIDRGTPERGLRLSLVATFVDPQTSTLRELPLPRCVEIWGHPPFAATDAEFEAMMDALLRLNAGVGSGIRRKRSSSSRRMGDARTLSFSGGAKDEYYDPLASRRGGSTVYCPALSAYIAVPAVPPKYLRWLKQRRLATKEVRNMMRIGRHQNVVHLYEVLELVQDSKSTMFLILELVRGGELFDLISSNSGSSKRKNDARGATGDDFHESTMRKIFRELVSGINFIHQCGIAHRDLKPENLLIHTKSTSTSRKQGNAASDIVEEEQRTLKIADFGLSAAFELYPTATFSPKIARGDSNASQWDGTSTVWDMNRAGRSNSSRYSGLPLSPQSDRSTPAKSGISPLLNRVGATALSYLTCGSVTNVCDGDGLGDGDLVDDGYEESLPLCRMTSVVGSPHYVAPEIISQAIIEKGDKEKGKGEVDSGKKKSTKAAPKAGYDGTKADVWSAGVILYAMLFRSLPFGEDLLRCPRYQAFQKWYNDARQLETPLKGKQNRRAVPEYTLDPTYDEWDEEEMLGPHWFFPSEISVEGRDLIVAMLNPNPFDRISIEMVLDHPWIQVLYKMKRELSVPKMGGLCMSGV